MSTIADLLLDRPDEAAPLLRQRIGALGLVVPVSGQAPGADLLGQVVEAVTSFLKLPLGNLVFWAWGAQRQVERACELTHGHPGSSRRVVVGHHTLTSEHRPTVEAEVQGLAVTLLEVVLTLELEIESVVVHVEEGRVVSTGAGRAHGRAQLAVARPGGEPTTLLERTTPAVELSPYRYVPAPRASEAPAAVDVPATAVPGPRA